MRLLNASNLAAVLIDGRNCFAAFYAQQVAAAAAADPYAAAAYGLYGSPGGLAGMGAGPGGMPVGSMAASAFGSAHMSGAQLGQMGGGPLGQVPLAGGGGPGERLLRHRW